ncbi:sensor histidine kinase [Bryocella elongata]|nr:sensor histidine kinase [Bryocella elongata]
MTSRVWSIQDGLPDQVILSMAQTPDQYLWLGTRLGLVRFDGYHFIDYGADLAPALHDFGVDCVLVVRDGSLWLGTQGGGVVHLFPGGGRTYNTRAGIANGLIRALYQDEAGRIWAGTDNGLYRLDSGEHFSRIDDRGGIHGAAVHAIVGDGHGGVWAGGSRLLHIDASAGLGTISWQEVALPQQKGSLRIWSMAKGSGESLWIATLGGLYHLPDGVGSVATKEPRVLGSALSLLVDSHRQLWVGTMDEGLYLLSENGSVTRARAPDQLASNSVLALAEDRSHDLWAGTQSGLTRFSATGMHLTRVPGAIDSEFGSVAVDADDSLWVCSRRLTHIRNGRMEPVNLPSITGFAIHSVMRERSGAFWVGTLGRGAYRIAPGGHIDHYTSEIGTNYIRGFLETPFDGVWIASDGGVANWRDGHVTSFQNVPGAPHAPTLSMAAGAPGELWVGTYHGLSLLRNGAFVAAPAADALGSHAVSAIHVSDDGALWIGTESGLFRWHDNQLQHIRLEADMNAPAILTILEDGHHRMWLGGPTTVVRADRSSFESLAAGKDKRLFNPEIFAVSLETGAELGSGAASTAELDRSGGAWFTTNEGPLHIQASNPRHDGAPPPIMLGQVLVDGERVAVKGPVILQPSAKTLVIDAPPIALSARPGLQLRRRLIGFDPDWVAISPLQSATYTNLPAGHYTYRVEASWKDAPGATVLELPIVQRTHFYRQPAFLVACLVALLLAIWAGHRMRVRQVMLRFRLVAEERNRVAREMHDTVVQGCIGVSSLLEAIAIRHAPVGADDVPTDEANLLNSAREQIAVTILEARDAIWNLRHPHEGGNLSNSLRSLLDRITTIQGKRVEFESDGTALSLNVEAEHELFMTVREALHNALVHAGAEHIRLSLRYVTDSVLVSIRDDGSGFTAGSTDDRGEHFGLLGMHERMERIGGTCRIDSARDRGTMVELHVPYERNVRTVRPEQESR